MDKIVAATVTKDINDVIDAAKIDGTETLQHILGVRGLDVNSLRDRTGFHRTPLHYASHHGSLAAVKMLIEFRAIVNCTDKDQHTPLHDAAANGHVKVIEVLIKSGADVNSVQKEKSTPMHLAARNGHTGAIRLLAAHNGDVNARDKNKDTPLHEASWAGHAIVIEVLISLKADVDAVNRGQRTPLHIAAFNGCLSAVKMLIKFKADVMAIDVEEDTPLHKALWQGNVKIVKALQHCGADVNAANVSKQTPLDILIEEKKGTVLWSLVKEMNVDITWLDKVKYEELQDLLADEEVQQAEQRKTDAPGLKRERSESVSSQRSDGFMSPTDMKHGVTRENWNKGYQDGLMDSLDIRVALLGPEGSGKSSLADTLTGQKFRHDTLPTKGAEQMEVVVKNAINWSIIDKEDLIDDLQIRMLQEAKHCAVGLPKSPEIADIPTTPTFPSSSKKSKLATELEQEEMLTLEQFTELPALTEEYNSNKRYISIWDYGGQQVFHHTHGLFLSVEVVCLVVFDASKSLEDVPDRRCSDDHCPGRTGLDSICYWIELISHRVKKESTSDDDLALFYPIFMLVGTHIDLIDDDIEKAKQIAHQRCVPLLKSKLEDKPYARHIAGSKEGQLFDNGSRSIFFLSNLDELRDPAVIASLQETIIQAPPIKRRPIKFVKMERILLKLSFEEKVSIVSLTEVEEVAKSCGIVDSEDFQEAVDYLHQKGTILHFREVAALSGLAILCPQWLARLLTYVLTDLKHRLADATLRPFVKERKEHGFLREELLEWSVEKFNQGEVKRGQKKSNLIDKNLKVADLFINFNLMVDVTNTALAKSRNIPVKKRLYLVPHLIPEKPLQPPADPYYPLFFRFSIGFIPDILIDQLIVKCAEWNVNHNFDFAELSYQCVHMQLGEHQVYRLRQIRENDPRDTLELVIIPVPDLSPDEQEQAHKLKMEFVNTLKHFINDLMLQHMAVVAEDYPVHVYVPCAKCCSLHIELEKIAKLSKVYCSNSRQYADVTVWKAFWFLGQCKLKNAQPFADLLTQKPEMSALQTIVTPEVCHKWSEIAIQLDFSLPRRKTIKDKCREDPEKCCTEMFDYWLSTDDGVKPKTWKTLLYVLRNMKLTAALENIEKGLQQLSTTHL
ncbi:uncharacterized protein [Dysidea avara]|uniref:uncharacterized protein isoform X2 n=1 Tax=Dysidea avara TaxID=196820 RepID=UPI0033330D85